jgi:hypothetical protein
MAAPTAWTANTLVTQGLILAGVASPDSGQIAQAKKSLEFVKNKIIATAQRSGSVKFKTLQTHELIIGVIGQSEYSPASDYNETFSITLLNGTHTGTATAGGTKTVTLESGEDADNDDSRGRYILMTSGTSEKQYRQITGISSEVASVTTDWDSSSQPVSGDTYMIVDNHYNIVPQGEIEFDEQAETSTDSHPNYYSVYADTLRFDKPFDVAYGVLHKYYVDLNYLDLTEGSTTMITKIYVRWQAVLRQAVAVDYLRGKYLGHANCRPCAERNSRN